ncbi:uncharacterized protein LOC141854605 isoform X2 [Brevipalpus obovatus]|uniref:uncharacterized protein LOC141854605 isoform X2 n=1 Tax=Brevipalpus obovatus TaxID=246614 RepID=UPI003D9E662A
MNNIRILRVYSYAVVFGLLFIIELIINQLTHSLVILSDCYFNMFIWLNMILSIISFRMTNSVSLRATFGWARIEVLGALFNIIFTIALCFSLFVEGILNLIHSSHHKSDATDPYILLIPGIVSLFMNFCRVLLLGEPFGPRNSHLSIHGKEVQVNCVVYGDCDQRSKSRKRKSHLRGPDAKSSPKLLSPETDLQTRDRKAEIEVDSQQEDSPTCCSKLMNFVGRLLKATGTPLLLVGASSSLLFVNEENFELIDPLSGLIGIFIILSVIYPSLKESGLILLQTVPKHIEVAHMKKKLHKEFPDILEIHDLHIWCLTRDNIIVTCHLDLLPLSTNSYKKLSDEIRRFFVKEGVTMVTIQPEFRRSASCKEGKKCLYTCSKEKEECDKKTCCHVEAAVVVVEDQEKMMPV